MTSSRVAVLQKRADQFSHKMERKIASAEVPFGIKLTFLEKGNTDGSGGGD